MQMEVEAIQLETRHTFKIAREERKKYENFIFAITHGGITGLGEAAPQSYYGENGDTVRGAIRRIEHRLEGDPADLRERLSSGDLRELLKGDASVRAAIDMALWDIEGKIEGRPCCELLGLDPAKTPSTSFTIGFDVLDVIDRKVDEAASFPILKVKMGIPGDMAVLDRIIQRSGKLIRVDANEGWDVETALLVGKELADRGVEFMEQPISHHKREDLSTLKRLAPIPVILDESIVDPEDVARSRDLGHGINIKLMKCGGMTPALKLIEEARKADMRVMLGCMIETSISITAASQLSPLVDYADLDGNLLLAEDPYEGVQVKNGKLIIPERAGLGVIKRQGEAGVPREGGN